MPKNVSIMGYNIRNKKVFDSPAGVIHNAEFFYNDTKVAIVEDLEAQASMECHFYTEDEVLRKKVLSDMKKLLSAFGDVRSEGSLSSYFTRSEEEAVKGFTEFLLELEKLQDTSIKASMHIGDVYYGVYSLGASWFKPIDLDKSFEGWAAYWVSFEASSFKEATDKLMEHIKTANTGNRNVLQVAVLKGHMDWKLSMEDYVALNVH